MDNRPEYTGECCYCNDDWWGCNDVLSMHGGDIVEITEILCSNCLYRFWDDYSRKREVIRLGGYVEDKKVVSDKKYVMLTVAFKIGVKLDDVLKKWRRTIGKKWVKESYSCIEWGEKKGLHIHISMRYGKDKYKSQIERECINTWKSTVGDNRCIDFIYNNHGYTDYIDGFKGGVKKSGYELTKQNRLNLGLPDILEKLLDGN